MLSELHLKFHSETGNSRCTEIDIEFKEHATDEYLEWLEEIATKYFHQNLSGFKKSSLEDELHRRELRELNRLVALDRSKNQ